jgi:hypothetical protein
MDMVAAEIRRAWLRPAFFVGEPWRREPGMTGTV